MEQLIGKTITGVEYYRHSGGNEIFALVCDDGTTVEISTYDDAGELLVEIEHHIRIPVDKSL